MDHRPVNFLIHLFLIKNQSPNLQKVWAKKVILGLARYTSFENLEFLGSVIFSETLGLSGYSRFGGAGGTEMALPWQPPAHPTMPCCSANLFLQTFCNTFSCLLSQSFSVKFFNSGFCKSSYLTYHAMFWQKEWKPMRASVKYFLLFGF